jgi:hypothetical protein
MEPSSTAPILGRVSFEVVQRARKTPRPLTPAERAIWEPVQFGNEVGYVASQFLRSPVGYRAVFVRRGQRWTMTTPIAGD